MDGCHDTKRILNNVNLETKKMKKKRRKQIDKKMCVGYLHVLKTNVRSLRSSFSSSFIQEE